MKLLVSWGLEGLVIVTCLWGRDMAIIHEAEEDSSFLLKGRIRTATFTDVVDDITRKGGGRLIREEDEGGI